jgi:hypothetical protein
VSCSQEKLPAHTPGPWYATSCLDYWVEHIQPLTPEDKGFRGVAQVGSIEWPNSEAKQAEWRANLHLFAAGPELLALAKQYASECANCDHGIDKATLLDCAECADIRAVIAKAEGRS